MRTVTLPPTATSVRLTRRCVAGMLREHGLTALVDDAVLVVSELATNAVRHAGTPFTLTADCRTRNAVHVSLRDQSSQYPVWIDVEMLDDYGRGLTLVDSLSTYWGVTAEPEGGKTVWAHLSTEPTGDRSRRPSTMLVEEAGQ